MNPVRRESEARLEALRQLWNELRDPILEAQAFYSPKQKPLGARFVNGNQRGSGL